MTTATEIVLTRAELIAIAGSERPKVIARWLKREGWPYIIGIDRWPRVSRAVFEAN